MIQIIPYFLSMSFLLLCSLSCLILPKTNCLLLLPPPIAQRLEDEIRTAVPHPNAYYCPKDNAWVILSWKSSSVTPPLAHSFVNSQNALPDRARRRLTGSCIEEDQPFGKTNKTHHFHKYEKAVDSHKLTPPFRQDEWQIIENLKVFFFSPQQHLLKFGVSHRS